MPNVCTLADSNPESPPDSLISAYHCTNNFLSFKLELIVYKWCICVYVLFELLLFCVWALGIMCHKFSTFQAQESIMASFLQWFILYVTAERGTTIETVKSNHSFLFQFTPYISLDIIHNWLDLKDMTCLDTAACCKRSRN